MKSRGKGIIQLAVLAVLAGAMILTAILPRLMSTYTGRPTPLEISVIIREKDSGLWSNARLGIESAASELGVELRFVTSRLSDDGSAQAELAEREIENGADAIVIVPADSDSVAAVLMGSPDIPVVSMESPLEGADAAVSADNSQLGRELAEALLSDGKGGTVLILRSACENAGVAQRVSAAESVLRENGVELCTYIVESDLEGDELREILDKAEAGAVMAFEAGLTETAAAVKEGLEADFRLYGVGFTADLATMLEKGDITALAVWSDFTVGYVALESAVRLARGEGADSEELPFFVIRGDEIYEDQYQKLLFPVTS